MSSRRLTGCSGKIRHRNKAGACIALKRMKNAQMSAYPCRHCKGWHIGRSRHWAKINARLDQLIGKPETP
jgi:hypothetical protein